MGTYESVAVSTATKMGRTPVRYGAPGCAGSFHAACARARWPFKTAEHWAHAAGVKRRLAQYWLSGKRKVSDAGKLALIRELQ